MFAGIKLTQIWADEDVIELEIEVSDGNSLFSTKAYTSHFDVNEIVSQLSKFQEQIHGGIFDLQIGNFGHEYANGALLARLHYFNPSKIYITVNIQSDFRVFKENKVASEAKMYLTVAPIMLDEFINELKALIAGENQSCFLQMTV